MPVTLDFDKSDVAIVMTAVGPMTAAELVADYEKALEDCRFRADLHSIWELSRLNLVNVPISEIRQLPRLLRANMAERGASYKVAMVTTRRVDYQLIRLYVVILKMIGDLQFRVFESTEEAIGWVNEHAKRK